MIRRFLVPPLFAVLFVLALFVGLTFVRQPNVQAQSAGTRYVTLIDSQTISQSLTTGSINYACAV